MRLLLCRPQGGLNDILCQIERVCCYAEQFDRTVYVDTDFANARSFNDALGRYFVSRQRRLILGIEPIRAAIDTLEATPHCVMGQVSSYGVAKDAARGGFIEEKTREKITFDFSRDYAEPLLVHHGAGGGSQSVGALTRLRLHDSLCDALLVRLAAIGSPYTAIHIRHTDYKTRYAAWLLSAREKVSGPIFLATDNRECVADCIAAFGAARVHSFSRLPDVPGQSLHDWSPNLDFYRRNSDAILDLLMLALSQAYFFLPVEDNPYGVQVSGFSVLAANLRQSKPILARLIGRHDPRLERSLWL